MKCLEIGPGKEPIEGFETLDLIGCPTYVRDARNTKLKSNTFDLVYSSHCIEHMQWFSVEDTIKEWARIVKPGGHLEVFTVNGFALMEALVELEKTGYWIGPGIGSWKADLTKGDPYKWGVARIMNYPKLGSYGNLQEHRSIITPKYLRKCFEQSGLVDLIELTDADARGKRHGWINMGLRGTKC